MNEVLTSLKLANGEPFSFPQGRHNSLVVDTLEMLIPYRAPNSVLLYAHDRVNNLYIYEHAYLECLGVPRVSDNYLADIVLYQPERNKLYFIYAINRFGPLFEHRKRDTEALLQHCRAERVYVSVMYNRFDYGSYAMYIAWNTQVWLSQVPDHVILVM